MARPPLGAHLSIAGGHHNALLRGQRLGCDVVQVFTKNCCQWRARPLSKADVTRFHHTRARVAIPYLLGHASYLINLASPDRSLWQRSVRALAAELCRAHRLGLQCLVVHPGSHRGAGVAHGLEQVVRALDEVCARTQGRSPRILLETMAGQGHTVGFRFEQLAWVLAHAREAGRLGVCMDTCHVFAAGYDLRSVRACKRVLAELDRTIGLGRVLAVHLNDSKREMGSRIDRHEHIGRGKLGLSAFRSILDAEALRDTPMCLETPKGRGSGDEMDTRNLRVLRKLAL